MISLNKQVPGILNYPLKQGEYLNHSEFTASNLARLKIAISFFSYLNTKGEISDRAFKALVRYACSIFIDNEVELRVEELLDKKILQLWETKLSSALEELLSRDLDKNENSEITRIFSIR